MNPSQKIIEDMFNKGFLVNQDLLKDANQTLLDKIECEEDLLVLNEDYVNVLVQQTSLVDWYDLDQYRVDVEKKRDDDLYQAHLQNFKENNPSFNSSLGVQKQQISNLKVEISKTLENSFNTTLSVPSESLTSEDSSSSLSLASEPLIALASPLDNLCSPQRVEIVISYQNIPHKYEVSDFTTLFLSRYRFLENLLRHRSECQNVLTIGRLLSKKEKETVTVIGLVEEINETQKGNLALTVEDPTGRIKIFFSKENPELFHQAKDLVFDEVIGISGKLGDKIIFAENIIWPDLPVNQLKKSDQEEYIIFLSDVHLGSNLFLKEEFNKFLSWIKGKVGNEQQREIAHKVKYIVIAGDLVDGVGIYPTQAEELEINEISAQYEQFCNLIKEIPLDKQIIICPGNHDAVHLAEPQSSFDKTFAPGLFKLPNVTLVTNPAIVNVGKSASFSGFNVLLYHGYSFDYYVANVESIRNNGGYHRADLIMKFLLKRRHLAPSFKSTPYFPAHKEDPLLVKIIPDFFVSGHIHYSNISNYKGITLVCGSCWQGKTSFQEKLGHEPEPARVPIVNLKTREIKVLKFI
ncbi:MAG: metallophosphoesterase [Nanoarchaeota archaeon]